MDVSLSQNTINMSLNRADTTVSQYIDTGNQVGVPQVQKVENELPGENNAEHEEYSKKELDKALKKINNFLRDEHTHAEYSVHKDFNTIMIKIVDEDTNEVILEVPPKKILDMVASLCRQVGLLDKKA